MEYEIGAEEPVSVAVIFAVSSAEGCDPTALPPLYESIDPEALDRLFESQPDGPIGDEITVEFGFTGYHITVTNGESVVLRSANSVRQ